MDNPDPTNGRGEARAREADRKWFANYVDRSYRLREPFQFEFREPFDPDGHFRLVVARRASNGNHIRAWIRLPKNEPIPPGNDDLALEALFKRGTVFDA
jgi:hypothetical protein